MRAMCLQRLWSWSTSWEPFVYVAILCGARKFHSEATALYNETATHIWQWIIWIRKREEEQLLVSVFQGWRGYVAVGCESSFLVSGERKCRDSNMKREFHTNNLGKAPPPDAVKEHWDMFVFNGVGMMQCIVLYVRGRRIGTLSNSRLINGLVLNCLVKLAVRWTW